MKNSVSQKGFFLRIIGNEIMQQTPESRVYIMSKLPEKMEIFYLIYL